MSGGLEWNYDKAEDGTHKIAGEIQLRNYGRFLDEYAFQLHGIEESLEDSARDSWDLGLDPISLQFVPYEKSTLLDIVDTDNKVLNKVLTTFATLCKEIRSLQNEAVTKYYDAILFYGEGGNAAGDGASQMMFSRILPHLQQLFCFVKRCDQVVTEVLLQLAALYDTSKDSVRVVNFTDVHLQEVFEHLGALLVILVTLDEALNNQGTLHDHWTTFKNTVKSVHHYPTKFGVNGDQLPTFEKFLLELEVHLLTGKVFQSTVEQSLDSRRGHIKKTTSLGDEFSYYLKNSITDLDLRSSDLFAEHYTQWVKFCAIYVLDFHLFGTVDKKMFKQLWEVGRKIPAVTLVGNVMWFHERFLRAHLPHFYTLVDKRSVQLVESNRHVYLHTKTQSLPKETLTLSLQICSWMVHMETSLKRESTHLKIDDLVIRCNLFLQGLHYACSISLLLKNMMNLHVAISKPLTKGGVLALCKLVELLKCLEQLYHRHSMMIAESINHVGQHLAFQALSIIASAKKGLVQDRHYSEKHLDVLSSLVLAENALNGPGTKDRRVVTRLAISIAHQMKVFREDDLGVILRKLDTICDIQEKLATACNCAFLYWHRVIFPTYFASLFESKTDLNRISYMFSAFRDCIVAIDRTKHNSSTDELQNSFDKEICTALKEQVLTPLCHGIETNLRLHAHSHLQLDDKNPFRLGVVNYTSLLRLRPARFFNRFINIKGYVEHYMDETFYNLTTVALHDWKTYGEMRSLAEHKYSLMTVEDHLPSQTLEQGLDVLEIMRNIHIFVSRYLYNLNNQIFIEQSSNNKHLNTINIRHIANSIRTHGTGIMNTTVNFTYQFLRRKFYILSQFMYDEHIKSRLMKDLRFFRESKTELDQRYSFDRADRFNKGIRKLGLTATGASYLDQFRLLISHIGNAMGYVRMIRSGGLHCCSNAICFLPDLDDITSFEDLCHQQGLSESCIDAAKRLDHVTENLARNFSEGTEYFKLLVNVFKPVFRDPKNIHLRNFHMIVPPLTINFVEHSITAKEKLSKKNKLGAAFTDDGFAMGIAYILKLLDQYSEFDSLHWFESVQEKYKRDRLTLGQQKSVASREDEKLQQTMSLTAKRLDMYSQEFDLLYYSLSSARIFFQKDTAIQEKDEPPPAENNAVPLVQ